MIPRVTVRPGYTISRLLKGHWQVAQGHSRNGTSPDTSGVLRDMKSFVNAGITTFDVADIYTGAEELIGAFIKEYKAPIQVHTKYVPDLAALATVQLADTARIIERSLKRLNVEQLDLVQFHWWDYSVPRYVEVAMHLDALQKQGKIRHIGVTNFDMHHLRPILDAGVDVVSAQVQYSLLDRRAARGFASACATRGVSLLCYGTLAGGYLSEKYVGATDDATDINALPNRSLTKYRLIIDECGGWENHQRLLRGLNNIAQQHGLSISDLAIAYILAQENVAGCIIGASSAQHISSLEKPAIFSLSADILASITQLLDTFPGVAGDIYALERESEHHRGIMKYNLNKSTDSAKT